LKEQSSLRSFQVVFGAVFRRRFAIGGRIMERVDIEGLRMGIVSTKEYYWRVFSG